MLDLFKSNFCPHFIYTYQLTNKIELKLLLVSSLEVWRPFPMHMKTGLQIPGKNLQKHILWLNDQRKHDNFLEKKKWR